MNLKEWLKTNNIKDEEILFLSIFTDGFSLSKNNFCGYCYNYLTDPPDDIITVCGSKDADPGILKSCGVDVANYMENAQCPASSGTELFGQASTASLVVSYSAAFYTIPWLTATYKDAFEVMLEDLVPKVFDIQKYWSYRNKYYPIPECSSVSTLASTVDASVNMVDKFDTICMAESIPQKYEEKPKQRVYESRKIFEALLMR